MKLIIILLSLLPATVYAGETLQRSDFVGDWHQKLSQYVRTEILMTIESDFSGKVIRKTLSPSIQKCTFNNTDTKVVDDLLIIKCNINEGSFFKFVLAGWEVSDSKQAFGHMYMYDKGNLYNGMQVSFVRK
ncbi:MAG: hypothetical protein HRU20_25325 [Pseudomonadales bacterium]|nr:hypothetical protein [Pseudomonadales bacterium]